MDPELENTQVSKDDSSPDMAGDDMPKYSSQVTEMPDQKRETDTKLCVNNIQSTPHKNTPGYLLKSFDIHNTLFSMPLQSAFSDTSSVLSPASSYDNTYLSTDVEFTDSESENLRQPMCNNTAVLCSVTSHHVTHVTHTGVSTSAFTTNTTTTTKTNKQLPNFSPQRILPPMSPLHGGMSPTRSTLPDGFRDNLYALLPSSTALQPAVRVKVRSRHASFSTPPKSPADSQWRLFKVNKDVKEESTDDIDGERNFTQTLQLKNHCDTKLNVSDKEEETTSCPSSPRHISSPRSAIAAVSPRSAIAAVSPARHCIPRDPRPLTGRSTTPSPSPPFAPGPIPVRCVSPSPGRPNTFTLKRKIVPEECASPPKRPCTMGIGHPTVEYRARNNSPAPLSPLAVSSQSVPEGEAVRTVPLHLLDKIEIDPQLYSDSGDSSDSSPPRDNRQPG